MDPFGEPMYYENGIHGPPFTKFQARQEAFICYGDYGYTPNYSAASCTSQTNNNCKNGNLNTNTPTVEATSNSSSTSKTALGDDMSVGDGDRHHYHHQVHNGNDAKSARMEVSTDDISFKNRENFSKPIPRAKIRKLDEIESYESINTWHQAKMRKVDSFTDEMS